MLNYHQVAARFVVLVKKDVAGIGRNADPAVKRPLCCYYRLVPTCGEAEEPNESLLPPIERRRSVIYSVLSYGVSDREGLRWSSHPDWFAALNWYAPDLAGVLGHVIVD